MSKLLYFFFTFLSYLTLCSSGTLVGFSYDARGSNAISSAMETISFLRKNHVSPSQIRVFVENDGILKTLANRGVLVDLFLNASDVKNPRSWLKRHLVDHLPYINITSIIVSTNKSSVSHKELFSLLATLKSIHSELKSLDLNHRVKVSTVFSFPMLDNIEICHAKDVLKVVDFIRKSRSFMVFETTINGALSMGDQFVGMMIKEAISAANRLSYEDVPIVLNVKNSVVPSAIEVTEFTKKIMTGVRSEERITDKISGLFVQISPMDEAEQKELNREEEQIFPSSRRELFDIKHTPAVKVTLHDNINQPTPTTIPQVYPTPTIVTVPSTNPVSVAPMNPATNPFAVPSTTPVITTPVTVPPTNPVTTPSMVPPAGNQVPPFLAVPIAPPTINNPAPPVGGIPITPPIGTPIFNPVTPPTTSGQSWCVAKTGMMEIAVQAALDYACGNGGADCSAIQTSGSCYNPNNLQSHASYAFNSYYQKNPVPSSCDFKGTAVLVNSNPSTGSCIFPSSSTSFSPPATTSSSQPPPATPSSQLPPFSLLPPSAQFPPPTTSSSSSPPATSSTLPPFTLNSSNPGLSTPTIYGSYPPPGSNSSVAVAIGLQPLFAYTILVPLLITGKMCWA